MAEEAAERAAVDLRCAASQGRYAAMLEQAAFKSAMLVSAGIATLEAALSRLLWAALSRQDRPPLPEPEVLRIVETAFRDGLEEPALGVFRIERV